MPLDSIFLYVVFWMKNLWLYKSMDYYTLVERSVCQHCQLQKNFSVVFEKQKKILCSENYLNLGTPEYLLLFMHKNKKK